MSENRCCCNCRHNIRTGTVLNIETHCDIDGHCIDYISCFEGWCRHWAKENISDFERLKRAQSVLFASMEDTIEAESEADDNA